MAMNFLQAKVDLMNFKKAHLHFNYEVYDDGRIAIWDKRGIVKKVIKSRDVNRMSIFENYVQLRLLQGLLTDKTKENK